MSHNGSSIVRYILDLENSKFEDVKMPKSFFGRNCAARGPMYFEYRSQCSIPEAGGGGAGMIAVPRTRFFCFYVFLARLQGTECLAVVTKR